MLRPVEFPERKFTSGSYSKESLRPAGIWSERTVPWVASSTSFWTSIHPSEVRPKPVHTEGMTAPFAALMMVFGLVSALEREAGARMKSAPAVGLLDASFPMVKNTGSASSFPFSSSMYM